MIKMSGGEDYPQYMNSGNHTESPLLPRVGEVGKGGRSCKRKLISSGMITGQGSMTRR